MIELRPSKYSGIINAPASKSYLQRALAIAAISRGQSILYNISWCDDSNVVLDIINQLDCKYNISNDAISLYPNYPQLKSNIIRVGESGLATRLFSPILSLYSMEFHIIGRGSLLDRPHTLTIDALKQLGVKIENKNGYLPLTIFGPITNNYIEIQANLTSQHLSGLLIALPLSKNDSIIKVNSLKSRPYVEMTLEIINKFGVEIENNDFKEFRIKGNQNYSGNEYNIEGDWSGAAFHLVAAAIAGEITVNNLNSNSLQGDRIIIEVLKNAGAIINIDKNSIKIKSNKLNAFQFDANNTPDLFPPLVALAANCNGVSTIKGVNRLVHKESNRALILKEEFSKLGVHISLNDDVMEITGKNRFPIKNDIIVDSHNDHRIAMALAIASLSVNNIIKLENEEAVNKSYPSFFDDFINCKSNKRII